MKPKILFSLLGAVSLWLYTSCSTNPVTGKKELMLLSKDQEVAMGAEADPGIINYFGLYEDEKLQNFINQKGEEMAKISHRPELDYQFKIVDSPVVNAFAVPGGYIYFTRGIMAHFNNEAEFAGVLGHEIGHVTARHSAKQYSKSMLAQLGLVVGVMVSEDFAQFADLAQTGVALLFLKYGRDHERQSDRLGVEYSSKIGYDARSMAGFFNTLNRMRGDEGGSVPTFLSTHPDPADRYEKVQEMAEKWQTENPGKTYEVNRESYLRMIDGIIYGEDPRQGYVEDNMFYHPEMKFQYPIPSDWATQNTPSQVQMAPKDGSALMILTLSAEKGLEAAAEAVLQNYNLSLEDSKQVNNNGMPSIVMVANQEQEGQTLKLLIYTIQDDQHIYNFLGVTTTTNFNNYYSTFNEVMSNFKKLNDPSKINRRPTKVRVREVGNNGTLLQVLQGYNMKGDDLEELAVLNGMSLEDRVEKGTLVKIFER